MTDQEGRDVVAQIYGELSDEAKKLLIDVLNLEKESLHMADSRSLTARVSDQIIRKVEAIVK